jgi:membrane-bound serine protease (ClpP class)
MFRIQAGMTGVAISMLRPVGKVRFGEDSLDAVAVEGIIEAGRCVRVLRRDGNRIVVQEQADESPRG